MPLPLWNNKPRRELNYRRAQTMREFCTATNGLVKQPLVSGEAKGAPCMCQTNVPHTKQFGARAYAQRLCLNEVPFPAKCALFCHIGSPEADFFQHNCSFAIPRCLT